MRSLTFIFFSFILMLSFSIKGQVQLSVYSEISIITADSGDNLYESFGHSALRLKDPILNLDLVYNYGVFDFDAPNFYSNFVKGRLLYKLVRYNFSYFLDGYKKDKRWIKQQVLNLTQPERQAFFLYLEQNATPQNATYLYDPFFDNCASKLTDITKDILKEKVEFVDEGIEKDLSFRELMNAQFHWNTWGSFGINLALGNKLDKRRNPIEYTYLPDYVYEIFKRSTITREGKTEPLVEKEILLSDFPSQHNGPSLFSPLLVFGLLLVIVFYISFKKEKIIIRFLDGTILMITGCIGAFLLFLWFFTNHSTTPNNFNILWAFPPNIYIGLLVFKNKLKPWFGLYFKILIGLIGLLFIFWLFKFQEYSYAILPILATLQLRYYIIQKSADKIH